MDTSLAVVRLLELFNPEAGSVTCPGTAVTQHRRCRLRPGVPRQYQAESLLLNLKIKDSAPSKESLLSIYSCLTCHYHGSQATDIVREWQKVFEKVLAKKRRLAAEQQQEPTLLRQQSAATIGTPTSTPAAFVFTGADRRPSVLSSTAPPTPPTTPPRLDASDHRAATNAVPPPLARTETEASTDPFSGTGSTNFVSAAQMAEQDEKIRQLSSELDDTKAKLEARDEKMARLVAEHTRQMQTSSDELAHLKAQLRASDEVASAVAAVQTKQVQALSGELAGIRAQLSSREDDAAALVTRLQATVETLRAELDEQKRLAAPPVESHEETVASTLQVVKWTPSEPRPPVLIEAVLRFLAQPSTTVAGVAAVSVWQASKWVQVSWFRAGRA